jgi:ATP-dependent DNA helicase RecG
LTLPLEPIRSILLLEQKRGYIDSAVKGGLSKYIRYWLTTLDKDNLASRLKDDLIRLRLIDCPYEKWDSETRRLFIGDVLKWLDGAFSANSSSGIGSVHTGHNNSLNERTALSSSHPVLSENLVALDIAPSNTISKLSRLKVTTLRDLLYFFPKRHIDFSVRRKIAQLVAGQEQTVIAEVWECRQNNFGGRRGAEAILGDETGNLRAVWFNQPYLSKTLKTGLKVAISGQVDVFHGNLVFQSPEYEVIRTDESELFHTGRIVPVYHLTEGLYQKQVRKIIKNAIDRWCGALGEYLPNQLRVRCNLVIRSEAVRQAHYPVSLNEAEAARRRLAFDELFLFQLGAMGRKRQWQVSQPGPQFKYDSVITQNLVSRLPYRLTIAQDRVLREILDDLARPVAMSRLLQGEVGSGKTVVAIAALTAAVASGYQGALLAPTEILSDQHYASLCQLMSLMGEKVSEQEDMVEFDIGIARAIRLCRLSSSMTGSARKAMRKVIASGYIDVAVGTHALIESGVNFHNLGLVVIDEQHRFGVNQRSAMRQKGYNPHILAMTATPIPRTLALTLYGDLDLSIIDEIPPGRMRVRTRWVMPDERDKAYRFVWKHVSGGRQAFIICPLIEESSSYSSRAAVAEFGRLSTDVFPDLRLGLLHGRMSGEEKDKVMQSFKSGELQILVSTSVVEVGVDVPNATVMVVEGADHFGLAQLHQFRGRVGRGKYASFCLLMADNPSEVAQQRLKLIEGNYDGFQLAEEDMKLRGPGDFFGTRQSGLPEFHMARLSDVTLLEMARREASNIFRDYEVLKSEEYRPLMNELSHYWPESIEWS